MIDKLKELQQKIKECYKEIAKTENEILNLLENNNNSNLINFVYWNTDILVEDMKIALCMTTREILEIVENKKLVIQCPVCLEIREETIKNRTQKQEYEKREIHRECETCRKKIMKKYRGNNG